MSLYVISEESENDLVEIYRYDFINYGENKTDLYMEALKKCLKQLPNRLNIFGQWH
jgi:plasmid stabilization system protein ParE